MYNSSLKNSRTRLILNIVAQKIGKAVRVETLACWTLSKMNLVVLFAFQVYPKHGEAPAVPDSLPLHMCLGSRFLPVLTRSFQTVSSRHIRKEQSCL